jgi:small subunit ribosomal protein S2
VKEWLEGIWMEEEAKEENVEEETVEEIAEEEIEKDLDEGEEAEAIAESMEEGAAEDETADEETKTDPETEAKSDVDRADQFLVPRQKYLASGIHIGMKQRTKQMRQFVYKIRPDGLAVMNLQIIDQRIRIAAKFLANAGRIIVISRRGIAHKAIKKFAEIVGAKAVKGRFMPGTLTNPNYEGFYETDVILVVDPMSDYQAVNEAITARIPIVAVADTFNETNNIDLVIPANNKGAKSIATLFWLLAREILKEQGKLASDEEYEPNVADFMKELERREMEFNGDRPRRREGFGGREGRTGRGERGGGRGRGSRTGGFSKRRR